MARTYQAKLSDGTLLRGLLSSNLRRLAEQGRLDLDDLVAVDGTDAWVPAWRVAGLFEAPVVEEYVRRAEAVERLRNARAKGRLTLLEFRSERDALLLLQGGAVRATRWAARPRPDLAAADRDRHALHAAAIDGAHAPLPERAARGERPAEDGDHAHLGAAAAAALLDDGPTLELDDPLDLSGFITDYLMPAPLWRGLLGSGLVVAICVVPLLAMLDLLQPFVGGVAVLTLVLGLLLVVCTAMGAFRPARRISWGAWIAPLFWGCVLCAAWSVGQALVAPRRGLVVRAIPAAGALQRDIVLRLTSARDGVTEEGTGGATR